MKKAWMNLFIAVAVTPLLSFAETVVLKDDFSTAITSQKLPGSARWFVSNPKIVAAKQIEQGVYALSLGDTGDAFRAATAYFTAPGEPVKLGDEVTKLKLTAKLTPASKDPSDLLHGIRLILGHSEGSRMTEDGLGDVTMSGYMVTLNAGQGATSFRYRNKVKGNTLSSISNYAVMDSGRTTGALKKGVTYSLTLEVERLANGNIQLAFALEGDGVQIKASCLDRSNRLTHFDTIGFGKANEVGVLNVQEVTVSVH